VIGKVLRGERPGGLIYYLYGPGRHEEHTDPHIVAGWRHPAEIEPPVRPDGRRDFRHLNGMLQQPLAALGAGAPNRPVWHCVTRAAPGDRNLSDDEWAQVAGEIMHRTGLASYGEDDDAVRWVAIRHADDHIHIVVTLARQDGRRPRVSNDYYRVREACRAVENRFGLRITAPGDRTAASRPTRAETEKSRRRGWREAPRVVLKREVSTAAAAASSEQDFFTRLRQSGVLVRKRFSTRNPGEVTGYSVAWPLDTTRAGEPVWYSGGKLAADLTLPKLRRRWDYETGNAPTMPHDRLTAHERAEIWAYAGHTVAQATEQIRQLTAAGDQDAASDAAWAAADTLHAAASALGSRAIRQAASAYDRAARRPYGRLPSHTPTGNNLRQTARLLSAAAFVGHDPAMAQVALITRLAVLAETVAELRQAQDHAFQAAVARQAAERLHAAAARTGGGFVGEPTQSPVATVLAQQAFPVTARPGKPARERTGRTVPTRPGAKQRRRPERPKGPHPTQ
jgi:HPt (histidine-containing phosphotransfer) domain-containing protein